MGREGHFEVISGEISELFPPYFFDADFLKFVHQKNIIGVWAGVQILNGVGGFTSWIPSEYNKNRCSPNKLSRTPALGLLNPFCLRF